jgi:hypothetical protein
MHKIFSLFFIPFFLIAATADKTPQQIERELDSAEAQYQKAKKMFNPWYTGPLLTPSASMMPPANGNTQPYLYVIDNYASFDKERKSVDLPSSLLQVKGLGLIQTGITDNVDFVVSAFGQGNWQHDQSGSGFGDMGATLGFCVQKQSRYVPAVKFTITETFPTGSYKNLSSNGLNLSGIGAGAYTTQFGLAFGKILFWTTSHPMNTRLFLGYQVSTPVDVSGFNVYGGGFDCKGEVKPGNNFSADLGLELSLSQRIVAALDIVYSATNSTKFHGDPGLTAAGDPSAVGGPYNDNLSLAPALEYNWNENLGLIAGAWFSVYGRSSLNFAAGVISVSYSFP